jgi:hypothetical protein
MQRANDDQERIAIDPSQVHRFLANGRPGR